MKDTKSAVNPKRKRNFSIILTVVLLAMVCYTVFNLVKFNSQLGEQRQINAQIQAEYEEQSKKNAELEKAIDGDKMDEYFMQKARDNGYVMPGERVFRDASDD